MKIKIGFGYDVHKLVEGKRLRIGGVDIPFHKGAEGHSDADVLIHAVCDALLGAANLRDIGFHFPDTDPSYKGINSIVLLQQVIAKLAENQWYISNIDCTVVLQEPKIGSYIPEMQRALAQAMGLAVCDVSVKATTSEGLGFTGSGEGVAAYAVALISNG
ncbi:MAG: 2-C-methyl-D-erythritol 2,4-cyclodiphosphate synthase [Bacteroidales bacterium]|nr:2-C-methyl-D-erythritol 2,4-cyclodiphosphate synthase [Bacteroidales bacterium]MDD3664865.1 2-C-methyl-D-erythritol 2,4-cyclodiphosphate synthase [Bacteroidales bacterium]